MVQLEDEMYAKLKKDADDNRSLKHIVWSVIAAGFCLTLLVTYGFDLLKLDIQRRQSEQQCQIAITQAETAVKTREIEQGDLKFEDYILWKTVMNKETSDGQN